MNKDKYSCFFLFSYSHYLHKKKPTADIGKGMGESTVEGDINVIK
jgi:hypothetical protein